ncbi:MAG: SAM-dependent methyltransferase [Paenibacillaceae bacterium]|jgi:SAM-dependent MidA family methyltransferase|nr:SAM-dependent methyltransferase [Paenibacillaceae bacterium]
MSKSPKENTNALTPLLGKIRDKIEASSRKAIPFSDYMELCLYDPDWGYYMRNQVKIGKEGDFYTAAHVGSVLGEVLAGYIFKLAAPRGCPGFAITEWGAGSGRLASQLLDAIQTRYGELYPHITYYIVEKSPYHRQIQQDQLRGHEQRVVYLDPAQADNEALYPWGMVLSNELLDAFPVHRLRQRREGLMELHVAWDEKTCSPMETELPCDNPLLIAYLQEGSIELLDGQTAEVNLGAALWIAGQARRLGGSTLITIDYGATEEELYGSARMSGTLMCYKNHVGHENPYIYAGEQDLTAHVDFSACIRSGIAAGLKEWRLYTQKEFLLEHGILDLLQDDAANDPFGPVARRNRAIRQLLLGDQMSELFKVLIQNK